MFPEKALLSAVRVTLFTRPGCGLCDAAKHTVAQMQMRRPFDYSEVDIMAPRNRQWKDIYDFDMPVPHVQSVQSRKGQTELSDPKKLFHRFTEQEVEQLVDEAERSAL